MKCEICNKEIKKKEKPCWYHTKRVCQRCYYKLRKRVREKYLTSYWKKWMGIKETQKN